MASELKTGSSSGRIAAPLVMTAAIFIFHLKPLLLGISWRDPGAFHQDFWALGPTSYQAVQEFHDTGHPPLWTASDNLGTPLLGIYLPADGHPLTLILQNYGFSSSLALMSLINSALVSIFGYLLFLRCRASPWAAAAAGFLSAMTGLTSWVVLSYPIIYAVPWLLCWSWSALGLVEKALLRRWLWNVLAVTMILLCGDAQMVVEGAYLVGAWLLIWMFFSRTPMKIIFKTIMLLVLAATAGWVSTSYQMIPAMLCFSRSMSSRTPQLSDYAATFPHARDSLLAGAGLLSRLFQNLFITFSAPLLMAAALVHRPRNRAYLAALLLGFFIFILVLGGRSGLAVIPYHFPLLKLFIRHYKFGVILQGFLFIGVALGFDAFLHDIADKKKSMIAGAVIGLTLTLLVLPDHLWRLLVLGGALLVWASLKRPVGRRFAPALLFALLAIDAGSYCWQTPYRLEPARLDPVYLEYVNKLKYHGRVQGMYPWYAISGPKARPLLPIHGNGYFGEYSMDSWPEFPLKNHAYFLAAICPQVANIENGVFSRVDFSTCFKSTDFVNDQNRHLIDLAALRYFFVQDLALSAADRYPVLSDPAYLANPTRPDPFAPWKKIWCEFDSCPAPLPQNRPALTADGFGAFNDERDFSAHDSLSATAAWNGGPGSGRTQSALAVSSLLFQGRGRSSLVFFRAINAFERGGTTVEKELEVSSSGQGRLAFSLVPLEQTVKNTEAEEQDKPGLSFFWGDPQLVNPGRTIKYRAGDRVMVFENEQALGRARIVHQAKTASSNPEALELMREPDRYDPRTMTLLLPPWAPILNGTTIGPEEKAELIAYQNDQAVVQARLSSPGYLVLSDTYYPGWRAFDRAGRELKIYRTDLTMRAVILAPGEHTVTFRYLPVDFGLGLFATLSALAGFILFPFLFRLGAPCFFPRRFL